MLSPDNRELVERVFPQRWPASFRTFIENFPDAMNRLLDAARSEARPRGMGSSGAEPAARRPSDVCDTPAQHSDGERERLAMRIVDRLRGLMGVSHVPFGWGLSIADIALSARGPSGAQLVTFDPTALPFTRVPVCACDPGTGAPPTRVQQAECRLRGGPCAPQRVPLTTPTTKEGEG